MLLFLTSLILATAHAVPMQTMHQGRLLDVDGVAMEGEVEVTFRLIDAETGGTAVWEETTTLTLTNGFYISMLGFAEGTARNNLGPAGGLSFTGTTSTI